MSLQSIKLLPGNRSQVIGEWSIIWGHNEGEALFFPGSENNFMRPPQIAVIILIIVVALAIIIFGLGGNGGSKPKPEEVTVESLPPVIKLVGSITDRFTPRLKPDELHSRTPSDTIFTVDSSKSKTRRARFRIKPSSPSASAAVIIRYSAPSDDKNLDTLRMQERTLAINYSPFGNKHPQDSIVCLKTKGTFTIIPVAGKQFGILLDTTEIGKYSAVK
jgi:hypothetical protein